MWNSPLALIASVIWEEGVNLIAAIAFVCHYLDWQKAWLARGICLCSKWSSSFCYALAIWLTTGKDLVFCSYLSHYPAEHIDHSILVCSIHGSSVQRQCMMWHSLPHNSLPPWQLRHSWWCIWQQITLDECISTVQNCRQTPIIFNRSIPMQKQASQKYQQHLRYTLQIPWSRLDACM